MQSFSLVGLLTLAVIDCCTTLAFSLIHSLRRLTGVFLLPFSLFIRTIPRSVTRFGEISPLWHNLKVLRSTFLRAKCWSYCGKNVLAQVFIAVDGKILSNILAIWSHWFRVSLSFQRVTIRGKLWTALRFSVFNRLDRKFLQKCSTLNFLIPFDVWNSLFNSAIMILCDSLKF